MLTGDGFAFDPSLQRYVHDATGHTVPADVVKRESLNLAHRVGLDLRQLGASVASGQTPIDVWEHQTLGAIKDLYAAQAALAAGGFDRLAPYLPRVVGAAEDGSRPQGPEAQAPSEPPTRGTGIAFALDRLRRFADDIANGVPRADSRDAIAERSALYAQTSNGAFETIKRQSHADATDGDGRPLFLFERSVYGDTVRHCLSTNTTDGCVEAEAAGWQPIGTLSLPGQRTCAMNCGCSLIYSLTAQDE